MTKRVPRIALAFALSLTMVATLAPALVSAATPGDANINIDVGDSAAGGSVPLDFELAYSNTTGTPVYVYVPIGAIGDPTVDGMNPDWDQNPADDFDPCLDRDPADYAITQAQIDTLGDSLHDNIVAIDEAHFGQIGEAVPGEPDTEALVVLAYNILDDFTYDCGADSYTAGFFAPDFIGKYGMNVIAIDTLDWENRVGGDDPVYEGVIAHELEHLLMNYSDPGELSWVDEGLADFAIFLNGWGATNDGHMAYQQVYHRETSLTRWGGGLENYGASYLFFLYLWERAGGNGGGDLSVDETYDGVAGDKLIKLIFEEPADGMTGVQNAINTYNATASVDLPSAEELFKDWAVALWLDAEETGSKFDFANVNLGPDTWGYTIDLVNQLFGGRGIYNGTMPPARWAKNKDVPGQFALPYGVSYETFRNPGPTFGIAFNGEATTSILPHTGATHWYAGYESQSNNVLNVDTAISGGESFDFWTWYFIEEGWDYGFVEYTTDGGTNWTTLPLLDDADNEVTTDDDPQGNNTEGNGLTGTSGGAYFVDQPQYIHLHGQVPAGANGLRFRYSTDAAYLDTGWFVDDVNVGGSAATLSSPAGQWYLSDGVQHNHFALQIVSACDLTPGTNSPGEIVDAAGYVYRFDSNADGDINKGGFSTSCMRSTKDRFAVVISNLPTGDLTYLDAAYSFMLTNTGGKGGASRGNSK